MSPVRVCGRCPTAAPGTHKAMIAAMRAERGPQVFPANFIRTYNNRRKQSRQPAKSADEPEVRGQRSEVRGQRSEVRGQRSEVRSRLAGSQTVIEGYHHALAKHSLGLLTPDF